MAGGSGPGSALVLRAKEARMRAQAADTFGITGPSPSGMGSGINVPMAGSATSPAQPIKVPGQTDSRDEYADRMYGQTEAFLAGLPKPVQKLPPGPRTAALAPAMPPPSQAPAADVPSSQAGSNSGTGNPNDSLFTR